MNNKPLHGALLAKTLVPIILTILFTGHLLAGESTPFKVNTTPNNPDVVVGDSYHDMAYTKAFAKRFGLSMDKVEKLDSGLQAIGFRAEKVTGEERDFFSHNCYFDVLVNNGYSIYKPPSSLSSYNIRKILSNYGITIRNVNDVYANDDLVAANGEIFTKNKSGKIVAGTSLTINAFKMNLFKGIDYYSIESFQCHKIPPFLNNTETTMLYQKKSGPRLYYADHNADNFTVYTLPRALHKRICPIVEKIAYLSTEVHLNVGNPELKKWYVQEKVEINQYDPSCN